MRISPSDIDASGVGKRGGFVAVALAVPVVLVQRAAVIRSEVAIPIRMFDAVHSQTGGSIIGTVSA